VKNPELDFGAFDLPFLPTESELAELQDTESDKHLSPTEAFDYLETLLPSNTIFLGQLEDEIYNFTSWKTDDHYYLIPEPGGGWDWAILRYTWDDNWGRWEWSTDARLKGFSDAKEAARTLLKGLFDRWQLDLRDPDNRKYKKLLQNV
jgi:hypothetical protein